MKTDASYRIQAGAAIFRGRMVEAAKTTCPKCGKLVSGVSEHAYFILDVIAIFCKDCRMFSIFGSDKWVYHPGMSGSREEQKDASDRLNTIAKETSEPIKPETWRDRESLL